MKKNEQQEHEIITIAKFITVTKPTESIDEMNENLFLAVGFSTRVGTMLSEAVYHYSVNREAHLASLKDMESETETTRRSKLDAWTAGDKKLVDDLKNLKSNLRSLQMALMQSIKTLREESQQTRYGVSQ